MGHMLLSRLVELLQEQGIAPKDKQWWQYGATGPTEHPPSADDEVLALLAGWFKNNHQELTSLRDGTDEFKSVSSVSREDIKGRGYSITHIDDALFSTIANKMSDALVDDGWWQVLDEACNNLLDELYPEEYAAWKVNNPSFEYDWEEMYAFEKHLNDELGYRLGYDIDMVDDDDSSGDEDEDEDDDES